MQNNFQGVIIENRIASAAANPYLVLAVNVAAGLDGIRRKMTLPSARNTGQ